VVREARDFVDPAGACDLRIEGVLPSIRYDEAQLTRVFQNLIGNALQHAGGAGASVAIACESAAQGWEFRVRDRGPGVPPEHRERIFRMFQRLSTDPNSTGIGLAIVKKIVESNGGAVGVRAAPEQGAEFFFTVRGA
jgi:signal transduction histidine kinase